MAKITYLELNQQFVSDIRKIITSARERAIRSVDSERVKMYWTLGKRIFMEEQGGAERAEYGLNMLQTLAEKIESEFGSGFSYRQLAFCRQFYRVYPIVNALRSQLNRYQYRLSGKQIPTLSADRKTTC